MGAPADADMDLAVSSTPIPGAPGVFLWTGVNVTDLGVNVATGDREYQLAVTEEVAGGLSIQVSDTPDVIIRFNLKRVNPRAT